MTYPTGESDGKRDPDKEKKKKGLIIGFLEKITERKGNGRDPNI